MLATDTLATVEEETKSGKVQVLELLDHLPDDASVEAIMSALQFKLLILRRVAEAERGENLISHGEAKKRLARWLTAPDSIGRVADN